MKKALMIVAVAALGLIYSCDDTLSDDITIDQTEMYTDPVEPKPGCDDPKGCD